MIRVEISKLLSIIVSHIVDAVLTMHDISVEGNERIYDCMAYIIQHDMICSSKVDILTANKSKIGQIT